MSPTGDGPGGRRPALGRVDPEARRVLGFPQGSLRVPRAGDLPWLRHPVRWARWRRAVRRDGPYAPPFEEFGTGADGDGPS